MDVEKMVGKKRVLNMAGACNGCYSCPHAPVTFGEYVMAKHNSPSYCPNAYEPEARGCGKYKKEYEF